MVVVFLMYYVIWLVCCVSKVVSLPFVHVHYNYKHVKYYKEKLACYWETLCGLLFIRMNG